MKVLALRPEDVPSLRPSTQAFMVKILTNLDIGIKSTRKDFLEESTMHLCKTTKVYFCDLLCCDKA